MKRAKKIFTAAILTLLITIFAAGVWLVDYQTGKIAFNKQDMRVDIILNDTACEIKWRGQSVLHTWSDTFLEAVDTTQKLLPPDIQGALLWLESLNK